MAKGIRRRAGGVLSRIVSRGVASNSDNLNTTVRHRNSPADGNTQSTAVIDQIRPSSDPVTSRQNADITAFSPQFLHQIILALHAENDIADAKFARDKAQSQLRTLERRYQYVHECSMRMREWKSSNRSELIEQSEDPEAEAEAVDSLIEHYEQEHAFFGESILDIKQQRQNLDETLDRFVEGRNNLKATVSQRLLQSLRLQQKPLGWNCADFEIRNPVDSDELLIFEEDCKQFRAFVGEEALNGLQQYPFRRTDDWPTHCTELERVRAMYGEAVVRLEGLESAREMGDIRVVTEVEEQYEVVKQLTLALKNVVEGVRHAGVPCRSNGSLRYGESEAAEVNHDGHEDDQDAVNNEMTPSEIEEYVMRAREAVEKWMANADFENDPDLIGPPTPQTPWTPGGGVDQLKDIEFGESFQYHSDSDSDII